MALDTPLVNDLEGQWARKDAIIAAACKKHNVTQYPKFLERSYRILFQFDDQKYQDTAPQQLFTILKEGNIENRKALNLVPKKGKGLVAFGFPQSIDNDKIDGINNAWKTREKWTKDRVEKAKAEGASEKKIADEEEKYAEYPGSEADKNPFVWQRKDGTWCLVHAWTVNVDDNFKKRFTFYSRNPSTAKFVDEAVRDFHESMIKLFGEEARQYPPEFVISELENKHPVYVGEGQDLLALLEDCKEVRDALEIYKIDMPNHEFEGKVISTDYKTKPPTKNIAQKAFTVTPGLKTALYTKSGGDEMPCVKPWDLFENECVLCAGEYSTIPTALLATPIPQAFIDAEVVELFMSKESRLPEGVTECPKPCPIDVCVGPAIKWAWRRAATLWIQVLITTFVLYFILPDMKHSHQIAITMIAVFASGSFGLYCEYKALTYFVVPWVQVSHGCLFPLLGPRPFPQWLTFIGLSSIIEMCSIQSNAQFALVNISKEFFSSSILPDVSLWIALWTSSLFGDVPAMLGSSWSYLTPAVFCAVAWLLSMTQVIIPLLVTFPRDREVYNRMSTEIKYDPTIETGWSNGQAEMYRFDPRRMATSFFYGRNFKVTFYEAFVAAAHASGMQTVACIVFSYPSGLLRDAFKNKRENWLTDGIHAIRSAQRAAIRKIMIDVFLKKSLLLKLQVSLYAIRRAASTELDAKPYGDVEWFLCLQIILTFSVGIFSQLDILYTCFLRRREVEAQVELTKVTDEDQIQLVDMHRANYVIMFMGVLAILLNLYSMLAFFFLHTCKVSLWNLDGGCIFDDDKLQVCDFVSKHLDTDKALSFCPK